MEDKIISNENINKMRELTDSVLWLCSKSSSFKS